MTATQIGQLLSPLSPGQSEDPNPRPSTEQQPALVDVVEKIFEQFALHYGGTRMATFWAGLDPMKTKGYWARKLAFMPRRNLGYGLRYLPQHPPSVDQFIAICNRCPPPQVDGLLASETSEQRERAKAKGLQILAQAKARFPSRSAMTGDAGAE